MRECSADCNRPQKLGAGSHDNAILQSGMPFGLLPGGATKGYTMVQRYVITNFRSFTNHHAHAMVDKEAATNHRTRMNLDTGQPTRHMRDDTPQPKQAVPPEPVGQPVHPHSLKARIAGEYFKRGTCCRISVKGGGDVFLDMFPHGAALYRQSLALQTMGNYSEAISDSCASGPLMVSRGETESFSAIQCCMASCST